MNKSAQQTHTAQQAFTLVEVMVGSVLLALALTALILGFMRMQQMSVAAEYSMAAMHIARNEIEELRTIAYTNIVSYPKVLLSGTFLADVDGKKHCDVTEVGNDYKEIVLTITWFNPGMPDPSSLFLATKIGNTNAL